MNPHPDRVTLTEVIKPGNQDKRILSSLIEILLIWHESFIRNRY